MVSSILLWAKSPPVGLRGPSYTHGAQVGSASKRNVGKTVSPDELGFHGDMRLLISCSSRRAGATDELCLLTSCAS